MKTTFKKSVLAFLTCVLALAFALTGCSGGGKDPKANFVGSWQYSGGTLDGEELTDEYMDMLKNGIVDPTKVTRSALQNASSIASMILTTESVVADKPDPAADAAAAAASARA